MCDISPASAAGILTTGIARRTRDATLDALAHRSTLHVCASRPRTAVLAIDMIATNLALCTCAATPRDTPAGLVLRIVYVPGAYATASDPAVSLQGSTHHRPRSTIRHG